MFYVKNNGIPTLVNQRTKAIEKKDALRAEREDLYAEILLREHEGGETTKLENALTLLNQKLELAERRMQKAEDDLKAAISKNLDSAIEAAEKQTKILQNEFDELFILAGRCLGSAKKCFQNLGMPKFVSWMEAIPASFIRHNPEYDGRGNKQYYAELSKSHKLITEGFEQGLPDVKPENLNLKRNKLRQLINLKVNPGNRPNYERRLYGRALRHDFDFDD
jgi:hypothetical protein